jgi:hypothetical protein
VSRDQGSKDKVKAETQDMDVGKEKKNCEELSCSVKLFDTVNLPVAGEYFVRGQLTHLGIKNSGIFEPTRGNENEDNYVIGTGMAQVEERGLIPIRLLTFRDNVHIRKGSVIKVSFGNQGSENESNYLR